MQSFLSLFVLIAFAHTLPTTTFKNFIPPFLGAKAPAFLGPPFDCRFLLESAHPPRTSFTMAYGGDPLLGRLRRLQVTCHWGFSVSVRLLAQLFPELSESARLPQSFCHRQRVASRFASFKAYYYLTPSPGVSLTLH